MRQAIGIDIGGTGVKAARVGGSGEILARLSQPTAPTSAAILAQLDAMIADLDRPEVAAIGFGVPGPVDVTTSEVFPGGYVDLSGPPLAKRLGCIAGRPVAIANDGAMALMGEARVGAAAGSRDVIMLTIGTGIGGASMLGGKVVHGKAKAGQLGHITIQHGGIRCVCGRRGCLETLSSGTGLGRHIAAAGLPASTRAEELLQRDDALARHVIEQWISPLKSGIDSLVVTLDPEVVVLGGGLGHAACAALDRIQAESNWYHYRLVPAKLGSDAGVIGAALAALEL
jgi:glucokinase